MHFLVQTLRKYPHLSTKRLIYVVVFVLLPFCYLLQQPNIHRQGRPEDVVVVMPF
jgi:hypothetical protein